MENDGSIDIVEKAALSLQRIEAEYASASDATDGSEVENHPVLNDGMSMIKFKAQGARMVEKRRFVWVDAAGLHWLNARRKPVQDMSRGKVLPLQEIDRVSTDKEADKEGDAVVFTVTGM